MPDDGRWMLTDSNPSSSVGRNALEAGDAWNVAAGGVLSDGLGLWRGSGSWRSSLTASSPAR